ncbi:MAG: hypothetical protein HY822_18005, partial [Acidobacteria bacterium]|nr:hypothetical protein [Acidobacteriota bacterium]
MIRFAPYLLLLAEVVLFYRHILFAGYAIPWDLRGFHLPHIHLYADALRAGELPLWDPYTYCGRPFQANIQTAVFYPTVALAAWLGGVLGHARLLFLLELNVVLHVFLGGVFAFRLGRALKLGTQAALALATTYQLGGFFAAHAEHMGAVSIAAWLPFLLWAVARAGPGRYLRYGLLLAAGLALSILAGLTPLTAVAGGTTALFVALRIASGQSDRRVAVVFLGACGGAVLLAAAQLLPTLQLANHSIGVYRSEWLGAGGGAPLQSLVSLVWPNYYGIFDPGTYRQPYELTFMYLYSGILGLGLAVCAALRWRKNLPFVILLLATGFVMLGDSTPAFRALYALLPVQIKVGLHPEYAMPACLLALAILAGLGLEQTVRSPRLRWAAVALCAADLLVVSSGRPMHAMPLKKEPGVTRAQFEGVPEILDKMRARALVTQPPGRLDGLNNVMVWAMAAPTIQLPNANGNDPLAPARLIQARLAFVKGERWGAYYEVDDLRSPVLGMMNVRFLVSRQRLEPERLQGSPFVFREDIPGFSVYENPAALERFWLVGRVRPARSQAEAAAMLRSRDFRPAEEAIIEGAVDLP